jgi:hypothetical protein
MMKPETTTPASEPTGSVTVANPEVEQTPEVQAAMFLHSALPMFRNQLDKLTGTQAKRVLSALMEAPLEKETPGFTTREADDLFALGLMISNAKFILFNVALKDKEITDKVEEEAAQAGAEAAANTQGE